MSSPTTGKRGREGSDPAQLTDPMAVDPREAATFSTDTEISAMTPVEWLVKYVGDDYTPAQLRAISSANDRWCNTYFGNGASFLNLRPGGAAMGAENIDIAVELNRGMDDPEAHVISEVNRIAGSSATVLETKLVGEGRIALVRLQGAYALHATLLTRAALFGVASYKGSQSWNALFDEGPVVVALPHGRIPVVGGVFAYHSLQRAQLAPLRACLL